jgi:hypothetical protein
MFGKPKLESIRHEASRLGIGESLTTLQVLAIVILIVIDVGLLIAALSWREHKRKGKAGQRSFMRTISAAKTIGSHVSQSGGA